MVESDFLTDCHGKDAHDLFPPGNGSTHITGTGGRASPPRRLTMMN